MNDADNEILSLIADPCTPYWLQDAARASLKVDPVDAAAAIYRLNELHQIRVEAILDPVEVGRPFTHGDASCRGCGWKTIDPERKHYCRVCDPEGTREIRADLRKAKVLEDQYNATHGPEGD